MTVSREAMNDVYYDPYDVAINADPYPVFRRLRNEALGRLQIGRLVRAARHLHAGDANAVRHGTNCNLGA